MMKMLSLFIVVFLLSFGCQKERPHPMIQKQSQEKKETSADTKAAPITEAGKAETETYAYDARGRRDPFLSIIEASKMEKEAGKKRKGAAPTESYDVADIKVIAIASDSKRYYAMMQLPDKKFFTVREGMTIGLFSGKVIKIDSTGVVIREYVKNFKGETQPKDTLLKLRREEGE
jgi:Tfp pilus assembly protein PilP